MLKVLGYDMLSSGTVLPEDASYKVVEDQPDDQYYCFVFRDSHVVGSIPLGDTHQAAGAKEIAEKEKDRTKKK